MRPSHFIKKCWRCPSGSFAWQVVDNLGVIYDSGKERTQYEANERANAKKQEHIEKAQAEAPAPATDVSEARRRYKANTHSVFQIKPKEHHA
jgi:flagellar basal body rod protein FlgC